MIYIFYLNIYYLYDFSQRKNLLRRTDKTPQKAVAEYIKKRHQETTK
jgi:hypothetical protein